MYLPDASGVLGSAIVCTVGTVSAANTPNAPIVVRLSAMPRNDHSHFLSELSFYCQISAFFVVIVPDTPFHVAP